MFIHNAPLCFSHFYTNFKLFTKILLSLQINITTFFFLKRCLYYNLFIKTVQKLLNLTKASLE